MPTAGKLAPWFSVLSISAKELPDPLLCYWDITHKYDQWNALSVVSGQQHLLREASCNKPSNRALMLLGFHEMSLEIDLLSNLKLKGFSVFCSSWRTEHNSTCNPANSMSYNSRLFSLFKPHLKVELLFGVFMVQHRRLIILHQENMNPAAWTFADYQWVGESIMWFVNSMS